MALSIGCGQITWLRFTEHGVEWLVSEEQALADIAAAGYAGAPAGPGTYTTEECMTLFAGLGLRPAPGYFSADFWKAEQQDDILARGKAFAEYTRSLGLSEMYVATGGWDYMTARAKTRMELAGQIIEADGLSDAEMQQFAHTLQELCVQALAEGVRCCFHNHVGTVIETRSEFERLLALVDPAVLFLGPDTGHMAWAGDDVLAFFKDYAPRIKTLHIKDINAQVAEQGRREGWDYRTFSAHGIWTELGEGAIDFPAIFATLKAAGFQGWAIVETDVTQKSSPLESAIISREYLRGLGL